MFTDIEIGLLTKAFAKFGQDSQKIIEWVQARLQVVHARKEIEKERQQIQQDYQTKCDANQQRLRFVQGNCTHDLTESQSAQYDSYTYCRLCHKEL